MMYVLTEEEMGLRVLRTELEFSQRVIQVLFSKAIPSTCRHISGNEHRKCDDCYLGFVELGKEVDKNGDKLSVELIRSVCPLEKEYSK
jgi:hypothetical protein